MNETLDGKAPVAVANLREFFHDSVQQALQNQQVELDAQAEHYVVGVLTRFARSEEFYDGAHEGRLQQPLANLLAEALAAPAAEQQRARMQRLGDVSLFMAGFFAQGELGPVGGQNFIHGFTASVALFEE